MKEYKLQGQFRWIAAQTDRYRNGELYRCIADTKGAFVQPALYEAFGLTVIEAMNCGLPTFATNQGGPAEIIVDGVSGFHIDPHNGDESINKISEFFEKCKTNPEHWNIVSKAGLQRINECYTWKIYANKVLNMGSIYGFWRKLNKEQKLAKERYIQMFYNLQFRNLARKVPIPKEVPQEPQPMSTTPTKKAEAKAEATSKGHDAAQAKAEVPQTHLTAVPPKIESKLTSSGESSSMELAAKQSGDLYSGLRWGTDTRHGFTGNLYKALTDKGIKTFIDDNDLQRGDEITPSLLKAIEESRIFIPVFSINYATSKFCLDELVHIIHCYKTKGRLVLPVFFGVDPTNVRHHTGRYGEALAGHEKRFQNDKDNMERLHQWKLALTQAANLSGYHSSPGYEYKFIGDIVKYISNKISRQPLHVANYPVGLQSRVQQVKSLLDEGSDDGVRMVGLYGTGGLGKSTLGKAIYNFISDQFECSCFLENVRENSASNKLKHLQEVLLLKTLQLKIKLGGVSEGIPYIKERLHTKKTLLILDDVDDMKQLHALAGGPDWFGRGSRVIITTRDKHLLRSHGIESTHEVKGLYGTEALELLRWMAFKNNKVPSSYEDVLNRAVSYASGLPLVLEIVGSNLFGKTIEEWKGTLDGYEKIPNKKIHEILKVSYDALEEEQQSVFLDIACCFKGCEWEEFEDILRAHYGHCITHHLGVLAEKSLVKISSTSYHSGSIYDVRLHDLIEDMGKEVVRQESPKEPGERSRLWCQDDIVNVLKENTGTSKIEMIYMNFPSEESVIDKKGKAFKKMTRLKTLIIENGHFSKGLNYLPSSLRVLKLRGCLSESLLSCSLSKASEITSFSYCIYLLIYNDFNFQNMKVLTLDKCEYLTHIPDVSGLQNLEKFSFAYCRKLITIHNSIGHLNKLERLNAFDCSKLESFPPLGLASLNELNLSHCGSLKSFPKLLCKMTNIKKIWLQNTSIRELPSSFQNLSELHELTVREAGMLRFPKQNDQMYSIVFSKVTNLVLNNCKLSDECLPIFLKWCVYVTYLDLSWNNFKLIPECLSECYLLSSLRLDNCKSLEEIRGIPPNLARLSAIGCKSLSSSSRKMLLSQKLNEAGCIISFPNFSDGIPDCAQMGIHVSKEKSNAEENVIFTDPYREYRNTSLSQFEPPLKKQRLVEVVVSETEIWQQQHLSLESGMQNLVLTETKEAPLLDRFLRPVMAHRSHHRICGLFEKALDKDMLYSSVVLFRCYIRHELYIAYDPSAS
ncbi:disease resistance protein (TIR-NBS-LRR class) [Medicago truncatula]|uniref:Disease resistance protein (TIR-NBS-LRR class) n=1 Tax=Medicago truncatula TaxID=3880 RepID=A0A072UCU7_MEDTR|nr:disease resistance protein (TIR-NBS-LRR class) [Medicago truncatula]